MKKLKESGFSLVEGLLVIIALCLIVFVGFYVYDQSKDDKDSSKTASTSSNKSDTSKAVKDTTSDWLVYTTDAGSFSFKYPASWIKNVCDSNMVLLGPDASSAGKCQTDGTPQVILQAVKSDIGPSASLNSSDFPDKTVKSVTVDGVSGTRQSGTLNSSEEQFVGPTNGTKEVVYTFSKNGTTYVAYYYKTADFTDQVKTFDLMVTKTLKFLD